MKILKVKQEVKVFDIILKKYKEVNTGQLEETRHPHNKGVSDVSKISNKEGYIRQG